MQNMSDGAEGADAGSAAAEEDYIACPEYRPCGLKKWMPKSLYGRALLILVLPILLVQSVIGVLFFARHWDQIERHMASTLASEMAYIAALYLQQPDDAGYDEASRAARHMDIKLALLQSEDNAVDLEDTGQARFPEFYRQLGFRLDRPFTIHEEPKFVVMRLPAFEKSLQLSTTRKRLESVTTDVMLWSMLGATVFFLIIAILFLRKQIQPITELAIAANKFGMGEEIPEYHPSGAQEVRQAGHAFLTMKERIKRQITTRTEMLAGISHDLRTPLSRMKLEIAMLGKNPNLAKDMEQDIDQMEHMISEYLAFARSGSSAEATEEVRLYSYMQGVVDSYQRNGSKVELAECPDIHIAVRRHALRRALQNIIDNALFYGESAQITVHAEVLNVSLVICDNGPGIAEALSEEVFRPFKRLEKSRNAQTGGVGLGLTIARDIIHNHGGTIMLENIFQHEDEPEEQGQTRADEGDEVNDQRVIRGLCVRITLPRNRQ